MPYQFVWWGWHNRQPWGRRWEYPTVNMRIAHPHLTRDFVGWSFGPLELRVWDDRGAYPKRFG